MTNGPSAFRHVSADSHLVHGDPSSCVVSTGGSVGSIWCGTHEDDALDACWPGGQGYSNLWGQTFSKSFTYGGADPVTLSYDYFTDSEEFYDFAYVYVVDNEGSRTGPLNTSIHPNEHGFGYSGSVPQGSAIGSPLSPAVDSIVIPASALPATPGGMFDIVFQVETNFLVSDGLDPVPGNFDTVCGAFGLDNVIVTGLSLADTSDFEPDGPGDVWDGWTASVLPPTGQLQRVAHLDDLPPVSTGCQLDGNVMLAATDSPPFHGPVQNEIMASSALFIGDELD